MSNEKCENIGIYPNAGLYHAKICYSLHLRAEFQVLGSCQE